MQAGKGIESNNKSYYHKENILKLETKIKEYERLFEKINQNKN